MFGFFKKHKSSQEGAEPSETESPLSPEEMTAIQENLANWQQQLAENNELTSEESAVLYEQLGLGYAQLNDVDAALTMLEKGMVLQPAIGEGYKKLMSLYNAKRAEAARNGDDAGIELYMNKLDELRQIAKKITITG